MIRELDNGEYDVVCDICELNSFIQHNEFALSKFKDAVTICKNCIINEGRKNFIGLHRNDIR